MDGRMDGWEGTKEGKISNNKKKGRREGRNCEINFFFLKRSE